MRTRFAPAPTGWLHLGHVINAEFVWTARAEVLLRIEDHDRERCRPEYEAGILDDLDWLGYRPDIFHTDAFRAGVCDGRQSDRESVYREAVEILRRDGLVYACDCPRAAIEHRTAGLRSPTSDLRSPTSDLRSPTSDLRFPTSDLRSPTGLRPPTSDLRYDGHCRGRGLPLADGYGWRVRIDPGVEGFVDRRLGAQAQDPSAQCGDVLIRDRLGNWTYQFAVSVDDFRQGIDLVIRGEDLLPSTARQIRIARLLGREQPAMFWHHALIMKSPDQKLSKSDGDTGVRELRARGWTPEGIRSEARRIIQPCQ